MERPLSPVPVAKVGARSRAVPVGIALAALLLALAVVKPWGAGAGGIGERAGRAGPPARTPTPAVGPGPVGTLPPGIAPAGAWACCSTSGPTAPLVVGGMPVCYAPDGWEVVADVPEARFRSRTWIPVTTTAATGPADPRIRYARLVAGRVTALGFCAPSDTAPSGRLNATLWASGTSGPSTSADRSAGTGGPGYRPVATLGGAAAELGAIVSPAAGSPGWPPGRYVLDVRTGPPADGALWFGLEVAAPGP